MPKYGIVYLARGDSHAARLAVSLWSLRKVSELPVTILLAGDENFDWVRMLKQDRRAGCTFAGLVTQPVECLYLLKPRLNNWSPYKYTIYADPDTIFLDDPAPLFPGRKEITIVARTNQKAAENPHMRRLLDRSASYCPALANRARHQPCVSTGVFAFHYRAPIFPVWQSMQSGLGARRFDDEAALQLVYPDFPRKIVPHTWAHWPGGNLAKIWHFHGQRHKAGEGGRLFWEALQGAIADDFGGLSHWPASILSR